MAKPQRKPPVPPSGNWWLIVNYCQALSEREFAKPEEDNTED